ncbi:MAG TPA: hypothetical protein VF590_23515 [Isosphaeraceae bacterium]
MAYRDFTWPKVTKQFQLVIDERRDLFATVPEVAPSEHLRTTLAEYVPLALAISTEKARSELMIAPVLVEVRRIVDRRIGLFSGVDFTVDPAQGLNGVCDFLISRSPEQLFIRAPVVAIVEAKNENVKAGLAQCSAEMIAVQLFNAREETGVTTVYGVVTTGDIWKFLRLEGTTISIDFAVYHIERVGKILGILLHMVGHHQP